MVQSTFATLREIVDEANSNVQFEISAKLAVANLEGSLTSLLESHNAKGKVINPGSTNPRRFTAVSEATDHYKRFEPDIDIFVVTEERLSEFTIENICNRLEVPGSLDYDHNVPTYFCSWSGFATEISFVPKSEEHRHAPIQYSRLEIPLTGSQMADIKGMTLFLKRLGIYGGWHGGFKRLAAEQLVSQYGSLDEALQYLHHGIRIGPTKDDRVSIFMKFEIKSPLDGRDLSESMNPAYAASLGIWLDNIFRRGINPPSLPFDENAWRAYHEVQYTTSLNLDCHHGYCSHTPRDLFYLVNRLLQRTAAARGEVLHETHVLVVPFNTGTEIDIATNSPEHPLKDYPLFFNGFYRRIDSFDFRHKPKNNIILQGARNVSFI